MARFAAELRKLRAEAGSPTWRVMAQRTGQGANTLSQAAEGKRLPTLPVVLAYVRACDGVPQEWEERWREAASEVVAEPRTEEENAEPPTGAWPASSLATPICSRGRHGLGWWAAKETRREKKTPKPLEQLRAWWRASAIVRFGQQMVDRLLQRCGSRQSDPGSGDPAGHSRQLTVPQPGCWFRKPERATSIASFGQQLTIR